MSNRVLPAILCGAIIVNALWFTASAAIPLPSSDAWFFIDNFVRKALDGDLALADFFAQRHAGDHSQPLHRLILLTHMGLADLDFRIEALLGTVLAAVTCGLIGRVLVAGARDPREQRRSWWGVAAIFAVGLSLNSTMAYTWSLVGLTWISLLAAVSYWLAAAGKVRDGTYVALMAVLTFAVAIVTDELAFPIFAAAVAALLVRDGVTRPRRALLLLAGGVVGLLAGRWLIHAMAGEVAEATPGSASQLFATLTGPAAWKLLVGPLADSLVHQLHLAGWFPRSVVAVQVLLAIFLALLHGVFWWQVLRPARRLDTRVVVLAVACMLFFYAAIGGIALSRVGQYGIDYVHQPRYVVVYALNVIALLLVFFAPSVEPGMLSPRRRLHPGIALATIVLLLQVPLIHAGWKEAPFVRNYARAAAVSLAAVARDPAADAPASACPPILQVCRAPADVRTRTMALLREHGLSIFSPRFRAAHGLEGLDVGQVHARVRAPAPKPAAPGDDACEVTILKRGPLQIGRDGSFQRVSGGQAAFWLTVPAATPAFHIEFEGQRVAMNRRDGVATFLFDERQAEAVRAGRPLRFALVCSGREVGSFDVAVR